METQPREPNTRLGVPNERDAGHQYETPLQEGASGSDRGHRVLAVVIGIIAILASLTAIYVGFLYFVG